MLQPLHLPLAVKLPRLLSLVGILAGGAFVANLWSFWLLWRSFPAVFTVPSMAIAQGLWFVMLLLIAWSGISRKRQAFPAICITVLPLIFSSMDGLSAPNAVSGVLLWSSWMVVGSQLLLALGLLTILGMWVIKK